MGRIKGQTGRGKTGEGGTGGGTNNRTNERTNKLYAHAQINVRLPLRISQRQCIKYVAADHCTTFGATAMNDLVLCMGETNEAI